MTIEQWREICREAARKHLTGCLVWREACRLRGHGGTAAEVRELLELESEEQSTREELASLEAVQPSLNAINAFLRTVG